MALSGPSDLMVRSGWGRREISGYRAFLEVLSLVPMSLTPDSLSWSCWQGPDLYRK